MNNLGGIRNDQAQFWYSNIRFMIRFSWPLVLLLPEFGISGKFEFVRDYTGNHDQLELPHRSRSSTNGGNA